MAVVERNQWSSIETLIDAGSFPSWVQGSARSRVASYDAYEDVYWTVADSFKLLMRGQEGTAIYIPTGRKIVETAHRYTAPALSMVCDPLFGSDTQRSQAAQLLADFLRRERFYSKFSANKRDGFKRGDWLFYLYADPDRPPGAKISIYPIHPANYFPEFSETDVDVRLAVHLAELIDKDPQTGKKIEPFVRRITYRKETDNGGPSPIVYTETLHKPDEWGQPQTEMKDLVRQIVVPDTLLPAPIDQLPVYHIPNSYDNETRWGSSEMRGVERLMGAVNQGITDEELALVLEGLGLYVTDAGAPLDEETDEPTTWNLGPGRVVEVPTGKEFKRVNGMGSLQPYQDHLKYLHEQLDETTGANDVTRGRVEVSVAESGIALTIRMGPLLARTAEKELIVTDVLNNMFFDLRRWFAAYESVNLDSIRWVPTYGEKMPVNKAEVFKQVLDLTRADPVPIVSGQEARRQLVALGWKFVADDTQMMKEILAESENFLTVTTEAGTPTTGPLATDLAAGNIADAADANGMTPEAMMLLVNAATALVRAGFEPEAALSAVGLDPIDHLGLVPVTVKDLNAAPVGAGA